MTSNEQIYQEIKNEQWDVEKLIGMVNEKGITKPKYQRKQKWSVEPKKANLPSEQKFIEFLYKTRNSVHPITFGRIDNGYSNIDGNNRINAIVHFMQRPFHIFSDYLDDICQFIDDNIKDEEAISTISVMFDEMSYTDIMDFEYKTYFIQNGEKELYMSVLKDLRDDFEDIIDDVKQKLSIGTKRFDIAVKINVNIFCGYSSMELCKTFEDINRYNSRLTETELLACSLYNVNSFVIHDSTVRNGIKEMLKQLYDSRAENEVLVCHEYKEDEKMNAYDFMVGFQSYAHGICKLIEETNNEGQTLFFKVYNAIYTADTDEDLFSTDNINDFVSLITRTVGILEQLLNKLSMGNLTGNKIFDACNKKVYSLKKNNWYVLISSIIGYIRKKTSDVEILNSIEKSVLFHFFVNDIKNSEQRDELKLFDMIIYEAGGGFIDSQAKKVLDNPSLISSKVTRDIMCRAINVLMQDKINPVQYETRSSGKKEMRRSRLFYEKTLMYCYFKNKVPVEFLRHTYWLEHIFPFSCEWEGEIDIDRLGNVIPLIDELNAKRSNKHISEYNKHDEMRFIGFIHDIIPSNDLYDRVVNHMKTKPVIMEIDEFDNMCTRNEDIYRDTFLEYLFRKNA
jgi:hypothetical protein